MINVKNQKTALFAIVAIAALVVVSTIAIGSGRLASAAETTKITKTVNNTGTNVQTDTDQKQDCTTAGEQSGISDSCHGSSSDDVKSSGGILHK